ncbi:hypothetical protein [Bacteroides sp. 224]|uniref:hypothetical protein n=1 Tax=Bacteroides sp. 224 TaxID=2302936 RepID=UPI0013D448C9|nr:hypothetical protein [Bacteroides sp. 224]NDV63975.1 hypothetical protein [Bacteroides sp. 224]
MLLEINEIKLPEGKQMCEKYAYPGPGLFAINDGISYYLVYNPPTDMLPFMMPIPVEIVAEHFAKNKVRAAEEDLVGRVVNKLDDMRKRLEGDASVLTATPQYYQPEKIDGNTLLKAIAIAQNPELAKDLLNKE